MSARAVRRLRRGLRGEVLRLLPLLAVVLTVFGSLPREVFGFRAMARQSPRPFVCAFARLAPEAEAEALRIARMSWQTGTSEPQRQKADLMASDLPEETAGVTMDISDRVRPVGVGALRFPAPLGPVSLRAPAPVRIAPQLPAERQPTFGRAEMLRIDGI